MNAFVSIHFVNKNTENTESEALIWVDDNDIMFFRKNGNNECSWVTNFARPFL